MAYPTALRKRLGLCIKELARCFVVEEGADVATSIIDFWSGKGLVKKIVRALIETAWIPLVDHSEQRIFFNDGWMRQFVATIHYEHICQELAAVTRVGLATRRRFSDKRRSVAVVLGNHPKAFDGSWLQPIIQALLIAYYAFLAKILHPTTPIPLTRA